MDGYDTMRAIRKMAEFRTLPIIALTSRVMNAIVRSASTRRFRLHRQPVNSVRIASRLRRWLYRRHLPGFRTLEIAAALLAAE